MSKTNCINCGAAKDTSEIKCPFCGTTYLDLTAIDFASGDPVVCEFVLPQYDSATRYREGDIVQKDRMIMRMLAVPSLDKIDVQREVSYVHNGWGTPLLAFETGTDINVGVSFRPIPWKNKIFEVQTIGGSN